MLNMRRREFITLVGGAAAAWCSVTGAQTPRERPVIGTFGSGTPTQRKGLRNWPSFLNGLLRELGYIEASRTRRLEYGPGLSYDSVHARPVRPEQFARKP